MAGNKTLESTKIGEPQLTEIQREREREMEKTVSEAEELPRTIVRRVVKDKLSQCSKDGDINVHKDALHAFSESARIFIHYLSATANDICKESKRQIINGDDVLKAIQEIEFHEFLEPLKASLNEFKRKKAGNKARATKEKELNKKRKTEETSNKHEAQQEDGEEEDNEGEEEDNEGQEENEDEEDDAQNDG